MCLSRPAYTSSLVCQRLLRTIEPRQLRSALIARITSQYSPQPPPLPIDDGVSQTQSTCCHAGLLSGKPRLGNSTGRHSQPTQPKVPRSVRCPIFRSPHERLTDHTGDGQQRQLPLSRPTQRPRNGDQAPCFPWLDAQQEPVPVIVATAVASGQLDVFGGNPPCKRQRQDSRLGPQIIYLFTKELGAVRRRLLWSQPATFLQVSGCYPDIRNFDAVQLRIPRQIFSASGCRRRGG